MAFHAVTGHFKHSHLYAVMHVPMQVLQAVNGHFKHSHLYAVMGPSGAGKSTLFSVLLGSASSYGRVSGKVMMNVMIT